MRAIATFLLMVLVTGTCALGQTMNLGAPGLRVGIGFPVGLSTTPRYPLSFPNTLGDKISLWNADPGISNGIHYGFGIQGARFQMFTPTVNDNIVFGYGNSASFTENVRFTGNGKVGIGSSNPLAKLEVIGSTAFGNSNLVTGQNSSAIGVSNTVSGTGSVGIGFSNEVYSANSVVIGNDNTALEDLSIAMGYLCTSSGYASIAIGTNLSTNGYGGTFIIGDFGLTKAQSSAINQFTARFANGYRLFSNADLTVGVQVIPGGNAWSSLSDSTRKERFLPINHAELLTNIRTLKLGSWNYKGQRDQRHYGPMAQDFFARFGHDTFGQIGCDTLINSHDFTAVTLSGVQALALENEDLKARIAQLEEEQKQNRARLKTLEMMILSRNKDRRTARR